MVSKVEKDPSQVPSEVARHSSRSKAYCSDVAMRTTIEAVQVLGGYGYITEYPLDE